MMIGVSAAALTALADPTSLKYNTLEITADLKNPSRVMIDVTLFVKKWGICSKRSTMAGSSWTIPYMTPTVINEAGMFIDGDARSIWSTLGAEPDKCYIVRTKWVVLKNGKSEAFDIYNGKIKDVILRLDGPQWVADISTTMEQDEALGTTVSKQSGDELILLEGDPARGWV